MSQLSRKNIKMIKEAEEYLLSQPMSSALKNELAKMIQRVRGCSVESLYKVGNVNEYVTSLTCKHKGCNICNWNRQKQVRRKYILFLERNKELYVVQTDTGKEKIIIPEIFDEKKFIYLESINYDLMHLTLTVPHTTKGFNGNKYYYKDFLERFKKLRRQKFFKENIYGGEFGIETTNSGNGLNIHSHSLLVVKKFKQNRNFLHKEILTAWNKLTIDESRELQTFSENRIAGILKGNKQLTRDDVLKLDSRGGTLIGLENIFTKDKNGKKVRQLDEESRIRAVMETVSYHFAPKMFELKDRTFDFDLIAKVLKNTRKIRLYDRFGVFRQSKILRLKGTTEIEEFKEANDVKKSETSLRGRFYSLNPRRIYHNFDTETIVINPGTLRTGRELPAINTTQAIELITKN